jgi:hypothetical protein
MDSRRVYSFDLFSIPNNWDYVFMVPGVVLLYFLKLEEEVRSLRVEPTDDVRHFKHKDRNRYGKPI